ncbi:hypothetical protein ACSSS7_002464 [Eimeria intestinalis]
MKGGPLSLRGAIQGPSQQCTGGAPRGAPPWRSLFFSSVLRLAEHEKGSFVVVFSLSVRGFEGYVCNWNKPLAAVMDQILNCNIKFKHAAEIYDPEFECFIFRGCDKGFRVGRRAVVYCRGPDLLKWVYDNREMLNKKHSAALDKPIVNEDDAAALCDKLIRFGFLYRAQYRPGLSARKTCLFAAQLDGVVEVGENGRCKRPKWPKRLAISQKQSFDANSFYCCVYEGSNRWQHFMLFCVIAAVLCVCMFPAWPLKLKIGLWYLSVVFLTLLQEQNSYYFIHYPPFRLPCIAVLGVLPIVGLFLIVLRLILFLLLWFVGYQFWLLPNLFNEDAGFIDSFIPLTEFQKTPGSWTMVGARAFCALLSAATVYKLGETHSPGDVATFARQSFIDVLDWGRMRLEARFLRDTSVGGG